MGLPPQTPINTTGREILYISIFHCQLQIIKRSAGRSAVETATYRSGTKLTNEWDGETHDYTRKGGIVHTEIMLPAHAPSEFANRIALWNSVEMIEKSSDAQLAREIEAALPVELSREEQLKLVRSYVKDNFVDAGMCADFAIHDKDDGNPHVHIMLTLRPLKENGKWGAKCRKVYDLDERGNRISDGKGGWKNHRENTTDWNNRDNAEKWREAWAAYANRALEANGRPERIDHRSYARQGIDKIPTIHMGVAAMRMEQRGIVTERGNINRQIAADNRLLKEIKARMTRIYNWTKEHAEGPDGKKSIMADLMLARLDAAKPTTRYGQKNALKENAALLAFLQENNITSMQELYEKVSSMNSDYYDLRGKIVSAERQIAVLKVRLGMAEKYQQYKPVREKLNRLNPKKRATFEENHQAELTLFDAAHRYLDKLAASGEKIAPKAWRAEMEKFTAQKDADYLQMRKMRDKIKAVENLKKTAEQLAKAEQERPKRREQER